MKKHNSSQMTLIKEKESSIKQHQFCTINPFGEDFVVDETLEESIRYKCKDCGYEENVPEWLIDELIGGRDLVSNPDEIDAMYCPECDGTMIPKK